MQAFIASLMHAVEKRGSSTLAFVNSFGGKMPLRNMPAYTASKFALAGYVDSIRPELGDAGIRVVQIHPGTTLGKRMHFNSAHFRLIVMRLC